MIRIDYGDGKVRYMTVEEYVRYLLAEVRDPELVEEIARQTAMIMRRKRIADANRN